jgi:hypothetical protein
LEGELRAWLDRELSPPEMEAIERHLTECRQCSALSEALSSRAAYVGAVMGALQHMPQVPMRARQTVPHRVIAAALVLAAACLLLTIFMHKRPQPVARPVAPATCCTVLATASPPPLMPPSSQVRASVRRVIARNQVGYYLALDDDPIESGVVLRVTLPESGLLADVIFDEQGRPRAVRPLN